MNQPRIWSRAMLLTLAAAWFVAGHSAASGAAPSDPAGIAAPGGALEQADGELRMIFSLPFVADERELARIERLESLTVATTSDGGAIRLSLNRAVPFPTGVASVEKVAAWGEDAEAQDAASAPPKVAPARRGYRVVTTFRDAGTGRFLVSWKNVANGEYSLTMWDPARPATVQPIIAVSRRPILAAGLQPSIHNEGEPTVLVWTRGPTKGRAEVGMYGYRPARRG